MSPQTATTRLLHCLGGLLARTGGVCGGCGRKGRARCPAQHAKAEEEQEDAGRPRAATFAMNSWEEQCRTRAEMQARMRGRTASTGSLSIAASGSTSVALGEHVRNEALSRAGFRISSTVEVLVGQLMREEEEPSSREVCELTPKLQCLVLQHGKGWRLKVRVYHTGNMGWISTKSEKNGKQLIRVVQAGSPPRASVDSSSSPTGHTRVSVVFGSQNARGSPEAEEGRSGGVTCCLFGNPKTEEEKDHSERSAVRCCSKRILADNPGESYK